MPTTTEAPERRIVATADSSEGTRFALIENSKEQHVFTWRDDDANMQAVFSECAVNSITARDVIEFANNIGVIRAPAVQVVDKEAEAERIRICAYLGFDTLYSDDFCLRCSHEPTNCECSSPVYMAGWEPDETLKAFKIALFQEDRRAYVVQECATVARNHSVAWQTQNRDYRWVFAADQIGEAEGLAPALQKIEEILECSNQMCAHCIDVLVEAKMLVELHARATAPADGSKELLLIADWLDPAKDPPST